jgi:aminoglycoside phosphotransferase (APT) family kinase protein
VFLIMELLPGEQLLAAPEPVSSTVLGTAHAELHQLDAEPIAAALNEASVTGYRLSDRFTRLEAQALELPWTREAVEWLVANRPPEPPRLAACHNDFHKLNVLFEDGEVTGVVDWSGFLIADPLLDVATTIVLFEISARHLTAAGDFEPTDFGLVIEQYLAGYESRRPLDRRHLDYYRALRCLTMLLHWRTTGRSESLRPMLEDFASAIQNVTGVPLQLPS